MFKPAAVAKPTPVAPLDYEKDYKFLKELMDFKIRQYTAFMIVPMKQVKSAIISDVNFDEVLNKAVTDIWESLSPSYKKVMSKYMTEEALLAHITEYVLRELTVIVAKQNVDSIKNRNIEVVNNIANKDK